MRTTRAIARVTVRANSHENSRYCLQRTVVVAMVAMRMVEMAVHEVVHMVAMGHL
jgi:hypothetical protein